MTSGMTSDFWQTDGFVGDATLLPLRPPDALDRFGPTLIVAPHPDDESLGCGGLIALLRRRSVSVHVLFVTDGTLSHPNSRRYPAPALRALREAEATAALATLGVEAGHVTFLRLPDGSAPDRAAAGFDDAVERCRAPLTAIAPETVCLPWRRDPHPDHRAVSQIVRAAAWSACAAARLIEYPIWTWERAAPEDLPQPGEVCGWRLDIDAVAAQKQAAIACHASQVTRLIDDDPDGFWLSPEVLAHFAAPWEVFLETVDIPRESQG